MELCVNACEKHTQSNECAAKKPTPTKSEGKIFSLRIFLGIFGIFTRICEPKIVIDCRNVTADVVGTV